MNLGPLKGVYTLLIRIRERVEVEVGRLGRFSLEPGGYSYTGSAMGSGSASLEGRIGRHLGRRARKFWHIDHLLGSGGAEVIGVICAEADSRLECAVNEAIRRSMGGSAPIPKFGSSDCDCASHLLRLPGSTGGMEEGVMRAYALLGLEPMRFKGAPPRPISSRRRRRISL
jgi:endonuclease-3